MKRRHANAILIALGALGGGAAAYGLPVALLERAASTSGLSEMLPMAAPPLGDTARHLFVAIAALVAAALVAAVLPWGGRKAVPEEDARVPEALTDGRDRAAPAAAAEADAEPGAKADAEPASGAAEDAAQPVTGQDDDNPQDDNHGVGADSEPGGDGDDRMTFALPKLGLFGRGGGHRTSAAFAGAEPGFADWPGKAVPLLRRSDAHPDAPARAPLIASRDLDAEALPAVRRDEEEPRPGIAPGRALTDEVPMPMVRDVTGLSMPHAPEPLPWETIQMEMNRLLANDRGDAAPELPAGNEAEPAAPTIAELTDRLERGLARRRTAKAPFPPGGGQPAGEGVGRSADEGAARVADEAPATGSRAFPPRGYSAPVDPAAVEAVARGVLGEPEAAPSDGDLQDALAALRAIGTRAR